MEATEQRRRIEELERRIAEDQQRLSELRREGPAESVADRELQGWTGPVRLSELFDGKKDLIFVHNMGAKCRYCTLWADSFNGVALHLANRAGFVLCSPDPVDSQKEFAGGRGWRFRMVHDPGSALTRQLGYVEDRDGKTYFTPGVSTFRREDDGTIRRVAHAPFGPGDPYCGIWHLFALLHDGAGEWEPQYKYS